MLIVAINFEMRDSNQQTGALHRRIFLGSIATIGVSLSGCLDSGSTDANSNNPDSTGNNSNGGGSSDSSTDLETHPAATTLEEQPVLGPSASEAEGVIIEFADPSCPGCARFEENTFPEIKSELVESGRVAFIYREYPNVAAWGESASQALEGTYEQDEQAFWGLKSFYYSNTDSITNDNVLEKTEGYLDENTDVDASANVEGVRNDEYEGHVDQDVDAANEAGVAGTPSFFLFRSGSFVTEIEGAQDYSVFKNALGYS